MNACREIPKGCATPAQANGLGGSEQKDLSPLMKVLCWMAT